MFSLAEALSIEFNRNLRDTEKEDSKGITNLWESFTVRYSLQGAISENWFLIRLE